jgi:hypothetical protein
MIQKRYIDSKFTVTTFQEIHEQKLLSASAIFLYQLDLTSTSTSNQNRTKI